MSTCSALIQAIPPALLERIIQEASHEQIPSCQETLPVHDVFASLDPSWYSHVVACCPLSLRACCDQLLRQELVISDAMRSFVLATALTYWPERTPVCNRSVQHPFFQSGSLHLIQDMAMLLPLWDYIKELRMIIDGAQLRAIQDMLTPLQKAYIKVLWLLPPEQTMSGTKSLATTTQHMLRQQGLALLGCFLGEEEEARQHAVIHAMPRDDSALLCGGAAPSEEMRKRCYHVLTFMQR